ncbi:MAG: glycosyltransferase family 2 protein, partial [Nitrospira sp.]
MQTEKEPLVSVITPVYNGEKFIPECLESVRTQTYSNFEHIIVNNCSTDSTLQIAQNHASKDARVRIHNNNDFVTALENHNIALSLISPESKYVKIVQADDWIFPECIERMVAVALEHPSIGLVSAYRIDGNDVTLDGLPYPSTFLPGTEVCRQSLLTDLYVFGSPTSLLMRSDLIRSRPLFYDEARFALEADYAACYDILQTSDFGFVHQVLTCTRRHRAQQTTIIIRLRSYIVGRIRVLNRYGPVYLSASEYTLRRKEMMNKYLRLIGWRALHETDEAFWRFHRKALEEFGYKNVSLTIVIAAIVAVSKVVWEAVHKIGQALKAATLAIGKLIVHTVRSLSRTPGYVRQQTNNR